MCNYCHKFFIVSKGYRQILLVHVQKCSQAHVGEEIFPANYSLKSSVDGVYDAHLSALVESEGVENLLELVSREADNRVVNHVRSQVQALLQVPFGNIFYALPWLITRGQINVEMGPVNDNL